MCWQEFNIIVITTGRMPPSQYLLIHPEANLTQAEKDQLAAGIQATLSKS